jgi:IS5 family transposase
LPPALRLLMLRGKTLSNETHASTTDLDARLAKLKGKEAKLSYRGHVLVENRHGVIVDCTLTQATGTAEPEAAVALLGRERARQGKSPMTVGADSGYHTRGFVRAARALKVTPHVAKKQRYNAIDVRTTSHDGYRISQRRRNVVEEPFGWMKDIGGLRKLLHRGLEKVGAIFTLTCTAFNLRRLSKLLAEPAPQTAMVESEGGKPPEKRALGAGFPSSGPTSPPRCRKGGSQLSILNSLLALSTSARPHDTRVGEDDAGRRCRTSAMD